MKAMVLGDLKTLFGTENEPGKIEWFRGKKVEVQGVQIMSLQDDLMPGRIVNYHEILLKALGVDQRGLKDSIERISVALLGWPLLKNRDKDRVVGVAGTVSMPIDHFTYAIGMASALQKVHDETGIAVDITYHPMMAISRQMIPLIQSCSAQRTWQRALLQNEMHARQTLIELLAVHDMLDVGVGIENEPVTSDPWGNLYHIGNRLWGETLFRLPRGWGITADLQHLIMILRCLQSAEYEMIFPPFPASIEGYDPDDLPANPETWNLAYQFSALEQVKGPITFHVSQVAPGAGNIDRHITPPFAFSDTNLMDWPEIFRLMLELDEKRDNEVWYAVEQDGGHIAPSGWQADLRAFQDLQERLH